MELRSSKDWLKLTGEDGYEVFVRKSAIECFGRVEGDEGAEINLSSISLSVRESPQYIAEELGIVLPC